jgi:ribonucleotide reductase alpha subunit
MQIKYTWNVTRNGRFIYKIDPVYQEYREFILENSEEVIKNARAAMESQLVAIRNPEAAPKFVFRIEIMIGEDLILAGPVSPAFTPPCRR